MRIFKYVLLFGVMLWCNCQAKAQVGEKYYGRASYYADKFHGRMTSSGEPYSREEYTAAHRTLPFNTILEVTNTTNNKTVVVKVNDRGPFAYSRVLDLSFVAARDLELLANGEADIQIKVIAMDNPAYVLASYEPGAKGDFTREFRQHLPIKFEMKDGKMILDTAYQATPTVASAPKVLPIQTNQPLIVETAPQKIYNSADSSQQHKYIRVIKDINGNYKIDASGNPEKTTLASNTPATPTENNSPSNSNRHEYLNVYTDAEGRIRVSSGNTTNNTNSFTSDLPSKVSVTPQKETTILASQKELAYTTEAKPVAEKTKEVNKDTPQKHSYLQVVRDADGRVRVDTKTQNDN